MKINELRVGNWVYDNECVCSKIVGVKPFDDSVGCNELEDGSVLVDWYPQGQSPSREYFMDVNDLIPIPLSEDILLKCGFKMELSISTPTFICKQRRDLIVQSLPEIGSYIFRIQAGMGYPTFVRYVDYLHQLQNLFFAITGEELEVEL